MQKVLDKPLTACYIKYVEWLRDKSQWLSIYLKEFSIGWAMQ